MISKAALIGSDRKLPTQVVDVPGGQLRVRALTRVEAIEVAAIKDTLERDTAILLKGMIDPMLDAEDIKAWEQVAPAGELQSVTRAIAELSGMLEASGKDAYKSAGSQPDA